MVYGKAKDLRNASHGDTLVFAAITDLSGNVLKDATNYKVVNVQPDNTGVVALALEAQ